MLFLGRLLIVVLVIIVIFVIIAAEIVAGVLVLSLAGKLGDNQFSKNQHLKNATEKTEKALLQFADRMYNTCCNSTTADSDFICINVKTLYKKQVRTSLRTSYGTIWRGHSRLCAVPYLTVMSCRVCVVCSVC